VFDGVQGLFVKWGLQAYKVRALCFYVAGFGSYYGAHTILALPTPTTQFTPCTVLQLHDKLINAASAATSYHLYTDFIQDMM
jgi:hypothetical protein